MPWPRMRWRHHFSNSIRSSVCFADEHGTSILKDEVSFGISCFLYPMLSQVIRFYQIESHNSHNICLSWIFGLSLAHLLPIDFEQKKRPFQHSWGATSSALHCLQKFHPRLHGDSPPWWSPSCPRRSDGRPPENQRVPVPFYVLIFILQRWTSAVCFFLIQVFKVYFFQLPIFSHSLSHWQIAPASLQQMIVQRNPRCYLMAPRFLQKVRQKYIKKPMPSSHGSQKLVIVHFILVVVKDFSHENNTSQVLTRET